MELHLQNISVGITSSNTLFITQAGFEMFPIIHHLHLSKKLSGRIVISKVSGRIIHTSLNKSITTENVRIIHINLNLFTIIKDKQKTELWKFEKKKKKRR